MDEPKVLRYNISMKIRENRFLSFLFVLLLIFLFSCSGLSFYRMTSLDIYREHKALYEDEKSQNKKKTEYSVALYKEDEIAFSGRKTEGKSVDALHGTIEAALLPLSFEESTRGFSSFIPNHVKLKGVSYKDGILFLDLSKEILRSEDLEKALRQIALSTGLEVKKIELLNNNSSFIL